MSKVTRKSVLAVVITLGALILVALTWGSRLPIGHVATRSVTLADPPADVFALVTDFANGPAWRTGLTRIQVSSNGPAGRLTFTEFSGADSLAFEVLASEAPTRLVTRISTPGPFGGGWAYRIEPTSGGSRITISEHGEVYNPFFRFVSAVIVGHTATLDRYLTDVARKLNAVGPVGPGEVVPLVP